MTAGTGTGRLHTGGIIVILFALLLGPAHAATDADNPLRPSDTSSPRATLLGFIETTDQVFSRVKGMMASYGASDRLYPSTEERRIQATASSTSRATMRGPATRRI